MAKSYCERVGGGGGGLAPPPIGNPRSKPVLIIDFSNVQSNISSVKSHLM